jgi:predicted metal-dependent hydrolase
MIRNTQELKDKVTYENQNIEYYIKRSKRIKTSELIIDSDNIEVRTPLNKTIEDTRKIIRDKAKWILRKQKAIKSSIPEIIKPTFDKNSTLPYLGQNYPLIINTKHLRSALAFANGKFSVDITRSRIDDKARLLIRRLYEEWVIEMAYPISKTRVEKFSQKLSVVVPKIILKRNLKSRWASLTKKRSINFNMHLIKAPSDVIDYIVLHELCHLKIKEHSHHYWDLVYKYMPDYRDKIDWLNINGRMLVNDIQMG